MSTKTAFQVTAWERRTHCLYICVDGIYCKTEQWRTAKFNRNNGEYK